MLTQCPSVPGAGLGPAGMNNRPWTCLQHILSLKKSQSNTFRTRNSLIEESQTEKEKNHGHPYVSNLKRYNTNELIYKTETDSQT